MIKPEDLFAATNGGLDILLFLFPQATNCIGNGKKFKIRDDEKTASATLTQNKKDGNWLITDFGSDSKPRNAINWYAETNRLTWAEALNELAVQYKVIGADNNAIIKPKADFQKRKAESEEKEGDWYFKIREETIEDYEIEAIISLHVLKHIGWFDQNRKMSYAYPLIRSVFKKYNFYPLLSYSIVKNLEVLTFSTNETYPMYIIHEKGTLPNGDAYDFQKIYQPLHEVKSRRFMYYGGETKPKTFIHGLKQAQAEFKKREDELLADLEDDYDDEGDDKKKKKKKAEKLEEFILCSGGSDALNVALLGYWVGWMNSETADLEEWQFKQMQRVAKDVYQLQDIDATGKASAHLNAMKYLDLKTIELPDSLLEKRDKKLNFCKDVRDYFNHYTYFDFRELVKIALPYRFWEMEIQYAGRGDNKYPIGYKPMFDNVQAYNFLSKNGFYRIVFEGKKNDYAYIHIVGNIVKEIKPNKVKNFVHNFLEERQFDKDLRNMIYKTTQLNESSLSNLPEIKLDFTDHTATSQLFFFQGGTAEVTAKEIKYYGPGVIKKYVWEERVIDHDFKLQDAPFHIAKNEFGEYDIEIINQDCFFLKYLIQTSRVHWQTELEDNLSKLPTEDAEKYLKENHINIAGPNLTIAQQLEQKQHLINKIFALGYLLHQYKDQPKAWAVIGVDNKINDDGGSHGGSGKSIFFQKAIQKILKKTFPITGTNPKIVDNPHIYGTLTEHHQYIYMDDMDKYMKFRFFYDLITSDIVCNPKQADPYTLTYMQIPKMAITTNYTLIDQSPSTIRRVLYVAFSDYYHDKGENNEYKNEVKPEVDLGLTLFTDFNKEQWNSFYNTMLYACKFFLGTKEKINPPMGNVRLRNLEGIMGLNFKNWADVYFVPEIGSTDKLVMKEEAFEDFASKNKLGWSMQKFTQAIKAFCNYYGYQLNPKELVNTQDHRIIYSVYLDQNTRGQSSSKPKKAQSKEFIYIRTNPEIPLNVEVPYKNKEEIETTSKIPF